MYELIYDFASCRPFAYGVFGYGSSILQNNTFDSSRQIDVIFVVPNMNAWHKENLSLNMDDYSLLGKKYFEGDFTKGFNNISFVSHVFWENNNFKYGVIEYDDFMRNLLNWDSFFIPGRFQKPVLNIKTNLEIDKAIECNRRNALKVAMLLSNFSNNIELKDLFSTLVGLSYIGDVRMLIAEDPHKVDKIVNGNIVKLEELYLDMLKDFGSYDNFVQSLSILPSSLSNYLDVKNVSRDDLIKMKKYISSFLYSKNFRESIHQIMEGFKTNGIVNSSQYIMRKVKKRLL